MAPSLDFQLEDDLFSVIHAMTQSNIELEMQNKSISWQKSEYATEISGFSADLHQDW